MDPSSFRMLHFCSYQLQHLVEILDLAISQVGPNPKLQISDQIFQSLLTKVHKHIFQHWFVLGNTPSLEIILILAVIVSRLLQKLHSSLRQAGDGVFVFLYKRVLVGPSKTYSIRRPFRPDPRALSATDSSFFFPLSRCFNFTPPTLKPTSILTCPMAWE